MKRTFGKSLHEKWIFCTQGCPKQKMFVNIFFLEISFYKNDLGFVEMIDFVNFEVISSCKTRLSTK